MNTVVVLGGSGFVGRNLCPALAAAGCEVYSVSRSPVMRRDPRVHYIDCNYDNVYQLGEVYQRADCIFHLACDTTPATSSQQSSLEVTANLLPSLRLLEYLEHHCRAVLVYVSSGGTIYGEAGDAPCQEDSAASPISYYGASKASLELFLHAYARQTGNPVVILRPSNLYGPGQLMKQQFGFIPTLLTAMRDGGEFFLMGDGSSRRDFLFIDDFVGLCLAVEASIPREGGGCVTYNAGCGEGVALKALIEEAQAVTNRSVTLEYRPARTVDVHSIVLDTSKAARDFGWRAVTPLDVGLRATWGWLVSD